MLSKGDYIFPVIGARTRAQLTESQGALSVTLTSDQSAAFERIAAAIAGTRYDAHQMQMLDSERSIG